MQTEEAAKGFIQAARWEGIPMDRIPSRTSRCIIQSELVKQLLERGADPAMRNSLGITAADYAQEQGHVDLAKLLRAAEASS